MTNNLVGAGLAIKPFSTDGKYVWSLVALAGLSLHVACGGRSSNFPFNLGIQFDRLEGLTKTIEHDWCFIQMGERK
jgi:hypothetical protein